MNGEKGKRTFWTDWPRKLFSLIVASVSVYFIYGKVNADKLISNVKVTFREENPGKVCVVGIVDKKITASFKLESTRILPNMASYYEIVVTLPNMNLPDRKFMYSLDNAKVKVKTNWFLPKPARNSIVFSEKAVPLDVYVDKLVPVEVPEIGTLRQEGYFVQKELEDFNMIYLHGPSEALLKVQKVKTVDLNLSEVEDNMRRTLELLPPDLPEVTFKDKIKTIGVRVRLVRSDTLVEKVFKEQPLMLLQPQKEVYKVVEKTLPKVTVTMKARKHILDKYKEMVPVVYIDLSQAKGAGVWQAQISVANVPDRDRMEMTIEPSFVELNLEEIPLEKAPAVLTVEDLPTIGEKPTEPKTADTRPMEPKPAEPKPVELKPAEPKPAEPKPAEPKPVEPKPVEPKPAEPKPVDAKPVAPKPVASKPVAPKPAEPKPVDAKPVDAKPVAPKPADVKPVAPKPVEAKPLEPKNAGDKAP